MLMPIRHIKPQAALVATTRTQIGATPMLGLNIGVGFRLSEPAILVHEAAVWTALKAAAPSVTLAGPAMPKRRAEWLLAGHSVYRVPHGVAGRCVDWPAWVEVEGGRKAVSCRAQIDRQTYSEALATLAIDPAQATTGGARENPLGVASEAPPLQRMRAFGVGPDPLAAMGALGNDWPERRQWRPSRPGTAEAMARDGSHMGWPEHVDLRFFQQAAPDQWSQRESWTTGARFELGGFGPGGEGYRGALPRVTAVALARRAGESDVEQVSLRQQTLWFLPDSDIGVMWWNGAVTTDYVLDDSLDMLLTALKDVDEPVNVDALTAFAARRSDLSCPDPTQQADDALMPSFEKGWVWELILAPDDHPSASPPKRSYAEIGARLEEHRQNLVEAREAQARMRAFEDDARRATLPSAPPDGHDWRQRLSDTGSAGLKKVTIRDADLSALRLDGWNLEDVRFERCRFDRSEWRNCQLSNVYALGCSFVDASLDNVVWNGGAITRGELLRSAWHNLTLARVTVEDCVLDDLAVSGGSWLIVVVQGGGGAHGTVKDAAWESVSWNGVDARHWTWAQIKADNVGVVDCTMKELTLSQCSMVKPSVLQSDLSASVWHENTISLAVLSYGTSIVGAHFSDCVFTQSSFLDLRADAIAVDHCSFVQFNAQRLTAARSNWAYTLLDSANATNACFAGASFERCSLKEAMLYGADMRGTRVHDCNLIRARTSWAHLPESGAWRANLNAGRLDVPRRHG
jgi:uncharacterized protein YjbI with pentapeptide repeats